MNKYTLPFNLEHARAGEPIQTIEGRERRFIAYLPDRRPHLRVVVLDPKADKLYSHSESGEHCENVASLQLVMKPKEPAATKQSTIAPEIREELLRIVREIFSADKTAPAAPGKIVRWLAVWWTPSGLVCGHVLYTYEADALARATIAVQAIHQYKNPRAIRVEL